jgi:predicted dehydrogenase
VRAALNLRLSNGALATLSILADSGTAAKRQHSLYYGSAGTAELRGFPFTVRIAAGKEELQRREDELPAPPTPVADLVDCILRHGQPAMAGELAVHVVEVIQAAYDSARSAQMVKL